ncbi:MAG: hypothetical protein RLZZ30_1359 [Bacteroidota bacterium]|jgi:hypothetical protein
MMKTLFTKPFLVFGLTFLLIAIPLFFFNVSIFDGELIVQEGGKELALPIKLSLSYFIGIGIDPADMQDIEGFRLVKSGYFLASCLLIGFPSLMAYRSYLAKKGL